jgi:sulfoxide reductase heme-binding subunit YedZ
MKHDPTFWLLARASGFSAYVLLTAAVLAGIGVKSRLFAKIPAGRQTDTHRSFALAALAMLVLHGGALVLDQTVRLPLYGLVVPFASIYRPVAVALGVLAAELMAVVYVSFRFRRRIGMRNWRRLHWVTYAIFAGATAHGLTAGTDTGRTWAGAIYLAAAGAVASATVWRALTRVPQPKGALP